MIYVDQLQRWSTKLAIFKHGSCHMLADTDEELHEFARRMSLQRSWFQTNPPWAHHYDLTPAKRAVALRLGAVEVDRTFLKERYLRWKNTERSTGRSAESS